MACSVSPPCVAMWKGGWILDAAPESSLAAAPTPPINLVEDTLFDMDFAVEKLNARRAESLFGSMKTRWKKVRESPHHQEWTEEGQMKEYEGITLCGLTYVSEGTLAGFTSVSITGESEDETLEGIIVLIDIDTPRWKIRDFVDMELNRPKAREVHGSGWVAIEPFALRRIADQSVGPAAVSGHLFVATSSDILHLVDPVGAELKGGIVSPPDGAFRDALPLSRPNRLSALVDISGSPLLNLYDFSREKQTASMKLSPKEESRSGVHSYRSLAVHCDSGLLMATGRGKISFVDPLSLKMTMQDCEMALHPRRRDRVVECDIFDNLAVICTRKGTQVFLDLLDVRAPKKLYAPTFLFPELCMSTNLSLNLSDRGTAYFVEVPSSFSGDLYSSSPCKEASVVERRLVSGAEVQRRNLSACHPADTAWGIAVVPASEDSLQIREMTLERVSFLFQRQQFDARVLLLGGLALPCFGLFFGKSTLSQ